MLQSEKRLHINPSSPHNRPRSREHLQPADPWPQEAGRHRREPTGAKRPLSDQAGRPASSSSVEGRATTAVCEENMERQDQETEEIFIVRVKPVMVDDGGCDMITRLERWPDGLGFGFGIIIATDNCFRVRTCMLWDLSRTFWRSSETSVTNWCHAKKESAKELTLLSSSRVFYDNTACNIFLHS